MLMFWRMSKSTQSSDANFEVKRVSLSDMIFFGSPKCGRTWVRYNCATPSESIASLHGIKMEAFEQSVSVMVRIESYSPDGGNFVMKSMAIVSNGRAFSVGVIGNSGGLAGLVLTLVI